MSEEENKNAEGKMVPLDLARSQIKGVVEGKPPIVIPGQHLRSMRVLAQTVASGTTTTPTIITTNILQSAVLKQGIYFCFVNNNSVTTTR